MGAVDATMDVLFDAPLVPAEVTQPWSLRAAGLFLRGFFEGVPRAAKLHPLANPARHDVDVEKNVRFGPGATDLCDVYRPHNVTGPLPTVLYLHGGGFQILSKETHWLFGLAFARRGYLTVLPNYRLAPKHPFPAGLEDASHALVWLWRELDKLGGDKDRFVVAGESAGANFTMCLAIAAAARRDEPFAREVFDADVRMKALVPLCGIFEVDNPGRFQERWPHISRVANDRIQDTSRRYLRNRAEGPRSLANPLRILESDVQLERPLPPLYMSVGTKDPLLDDTRRLSAALTRRGVPHRTRYVPGGVHGFQALVWQARAQEAWRDLYAFLDEVVPTTRPGA